MATSRFVTKTLSELQNRNNSPIFGYEDAPLLTIEETVEKLVPLVSQVMDYVAIAKKKYNRHSALLTRDEAAAIYLYSMQTPFFSSLNNSLRSENRHALKPWFTFLKLFITALNKLPSIKATVWRGVNYDDTLTFVDDEVHIWWSVNSCSINISSVQSYLGDRGTLFAIDATNAKDISTFSAFPDEHEVVLMPGTHVRRRYDSLSLNDRLFILHLEQTNSQRESESSSNDMFGQIRKIYQRDNRIRRIMNPAKSFPIHQSYINLSIVKTKEQQEKEKQLRDRPYSHEIINSFEEIYGMKTQIEVNNIFKTCEKEEKQLLVFGRAGIGKSTFCRYVAYQWATGSLWSEYELLILIPLRNLTTNDYPSGQTYSLTDLIKKEIFEDELSGSDEGVLKAQFNPNKTLWILDGYDEIVSNIPTHLERLLKKLLDTPHHIVTSRPYLNTLSYDVQMEITGFIDQNIEQYVHLFFYQMKDELDDASIKCQTLLNFLEQNRSIWGIAHIPINLELICSVWSNEDFSRRQQLTITTLCSTITEWICRRYLTPQNKQILQLSKDEIARRCQKELAFLEELAFNAMKNNTIIIRPALLKQAMGKVEVSLQTHPQILNIGILKSFNKQGIGNQIEMNKDHYFVHLSFQEYFAARYLINALNGSTSREVIEFINYHKYNQHYTLVFSFAAGLLSENNDAFLSSLFWNTILGEPLDLVGIRHLQLVIYCLEEISERSTFPRCDQLLQSVAACLSCNIAINNEHVCNHLLKALQRAQTVASTNQVIQTFTRLLQHSNSNINAEVLSLISQLNLSYPTASLITFISNALDHDDATVRKNACEALGKMGKKTATNEVVSKLVVALGDENISVRKNACEALAKLSEKAATNEVIGKLVIALGDKKEYVRTYACITLAKMGEKSATNEVIGKLMIALGDEKEYVRIYACRAFGKMGKKAATNEVISKLVVALGDEKEDVRRSACEVVGTMGEKAATNEVISKLVIALGDKKEYVRTYACRALATMGEKAATNEVISKLVAAVGDEKEDVRKSACEALGAMGEKAATNEVISKLVVASEDEDGWVRKNAWEALGKMGEETATNKVINRLVIALGDENVWIRMDACETLRKIGEKGATNEVLSKLVTALEDEKEYVRTYACRALAKMGEKAATNEVISKLVAAVGDEKEDVRKSACEALGAMGEKAATNEVISKLVVASEDEDGWVRKDAWEALGTMGEKAATNEVISKLLTALEDENVWVKMDAYEALGTMGGKAATNEVISKLVIALGDKKEYVRIYACRALAKMGEKVATNEVISKLVAALGNETAYAKVCACEALGTMGEKAVTNEIITKLIVLLDNTDSPVYTEASNALENILASSAMITCLNPGMVSSLCLCRQGSRILKIPRLICWSNIF